MIEKCVLHLNQNEFDGGERKEKEKRNRKDGNKRKKGGRKRNKKKGKRGGKEVQFLLVSSVRTTTSLMGQEVS